MEVGLKQAISDLRDLVTLSEKEIEQGLGGTLPLKARHALSSAIGRGFEIGAAYGRLSLLEQQAREREPRLFERDALDDDLPVTPYVGVPKKEPV